MEIILNDDPNVSERVKGIAEGMSIKLGAPRSQTDDEARTTHDHAQPTRPHAHAHAHSCGHALMHVHIRVRPKTTSVLAPMPDARPDAAPIARLAYASCTAPAPSPTSSE
eukprot:2750940-Pleurochrysis_carterae.AAC.3